VLSALTRTPRRRCVFPRRLLRLARDEASSAAPGAQCGARSPAAARCEQRRGASAAALITPHGVRMDHMLVQQCSVNSGGPTPPVHLTQRLLLYTLVSYTLAADQRLKRAVA